MPEKMWNTQYMEDFNKKRTRTKTKSTPSETLRISYTHPKKVRTRLGNNGGHRSSNATPLRLVDSLVLLYYPNLLIRSTSKTRFFLFICRFGTFQHAFLLGKTYVQNGKTKPFDKGSKINREVRLFFELLKYDWRICDLQLLCSISISIFPLTFRKFLYTFQSMTVLKSFL